MMFTVHGEKTKEKQGQVTPSYAKLRQVTPRWLDMTEWTFLMNERFEWTNERLNGNKSGEAWEVTGIKKVIGIVRFALF